MQNKIIVILLLLIQLIQGQSVSFKETTSIDTTILTFEGSEPDTCLYTEGRYLGFPQVAKLGNRIGLAYKNGTAHVWDATAISCFRYSDDDSDTWSNEDTISHWPPRENANWQNKILSAIDSIFIIFYSDFVSHSNTFCWCKKSSDGINWTDSVRVTSSYADDYFLHPASDVVKRSQGDYLTAFWGGVNTNFHRVIFMTSSDGLNWEDLTYVDMSTSISEPQLIYTPWNDLLMKSQHFKKSFISRHDALTWYDFNIDGHEDKNFRLASPKFYQYGEYLYMLGRYTTDGVGRLTLFISRDWTTFTLQEVVDEYEQEPAGGGGYGDFVPLSDGRVMIVYYTTSDGNTFLEKIISQ